MRTAGGRRAARGGGDPGFTLIEIMVVVIILAILAATIIPQFGRTTQDAKAKTAAVDIRTLKGALERFFIHMDRYPTSEEGLGVLVKPPAEGSKKWMGPYVESVNPDPWQNPYAYRSPGTHGIKTYDLWSRGPDGNDGGGDDVVSWNAEE
jgi:general secretion pathway protein G